MFGDLILKIKRIWKQFWCIHHYEYNYPRYGGDCGGYYRCVKCERITDFLP